MAFDHGRHERTGGEERGGEVGLDHLAPVGCGFLRGGDGHAAAAGECGEDVHRSQLLDDRVGGAADLNLDGAVGACRECPAAACADVVGDCGEGLRVATHDRHRRAIGRQGSCGSRADASRAARYHGDLVGEVGIARLLWSWILGHDVLFVRL
jgi:hypothetical protein